MAIGKSIIIFIAFSAFVIALMSVASVALTDRSTSAHYNTVGNTINTTLNATSLIIPAASGIMQPLTLILAIFLFGAVISIFLVVVKRRH